MRPSSSKLLLAFGVLFVFFVRQCRILQNAPMIPFTEEYSTTFRLSTYPRKTYNKKDAAEEKNETSLLVIVANINTNTKSATAASSSPTNAPSSTTSDKRNDTEAPDTEEGMLSETEGSENKRLSSDATDVKADFLPSVMQGLSSSCDINHKLSDVLSVQTPTGWDTGDGNAPLWLQTICPDVVDHYNRFPSYSEFARLDSIDLPAQTTTYAAHTVCTLKIVQLIAASIDARIYLHAGSHLGAVVHGQPIPWDDDVDMIMDFHKKDVFLDVCSNYSPVPGIKLQCIVEHNAMKVWLQYKGMKKLTQRVTKNFSPFVDLFLFKIQEGQIQEVDPKGEKKEISFNLTDYFPTRPFYFGGITILGPPSSIAETRYKVQNCVMGGYNHRKERSIPLMNRCINCHDLLKVFPFVYSNDTIKMNETSQTIFPSIGANRTINHTLTSIEERKQWYNSSITEAQKLTDSLPLLNRVEIDNTISPNAECSGKRLKVVEFNAERGKLWLQSATILKEADVVILNEMDIGMARTDQQHTTRMLAYHLGMNYAWGLEFVELTLGNQEDRRRIYHKMEQNFEGLHGNALLTKCQISNATIFRDGIGQYFAKERNGVNAGGTERRLGGRMILLARILVAGESVVIGSIHKLGGSKRQIIDYLGSSPSIEAGDQELNFCEEVGLHLISSNSTIHTWPASCKGFGQVRGDIICSNLKEVKEVTVQKPCFSYFGLDVKLSDHALVWSELELP